MKNYLFIYFTFVLALIGSNVLFAQNPNYWLRLVDGLEFTGEVQTASNNTIVLSFLSEKLENTYAIAPSDNVSDYTVNSSTPVKIGRYSNTIYRNPNIYKHPVTDNWLPTPRYFPEMVMHRMYLELPFNLQEGQTYSINYPNGNTSFLFSKKTSLCESIKVNQVGYNGRSEKRRAFLSIWRGSLGAQSYTGSTDFEIYNARTNQLKTSGSFLSNAFNDTEADGTNYMIDISNLSGDGEYYLSIPGVGRSYEFGLGNKYAYHLYYVHMKGMFQQRCGMALEAPYTQWTRNTCHNTMYETNSDTSNGKIVVPDGMESVPITGGHHDAADFDQRSFHAPLPIWFMSAYEYAPNILNNDALDIPESGNGIPDIIDEALWEIKRWELLQDSSGGISAGTETHGHPAYGITNAERDSSKYGTYRVEGYSTIMGAANMAYAARLLKNFNATQRAAELESKALLAWSFYENNKNVSPYSNEWNSGILMIASLQLYLLTGEEKYHTVFKDSYTNKMIDNASLSQYYFNGTTIKNGGVFTYSMVSYALETTPNITKDQTIVNHIKQSVINRADFLYNRLMNTEKRFADLYHEGWGMSSAVGRWGDVWMWAYKFSNDQKYLDATSLVADFALGANPMGMCMTSGLGERPPYNPLIDSYDHIKKGLGPFPGVVVYYEGNANKLNGNIDTSYPNYLDLPEERNFIDNWIHIGKSEFTFIETMTPNIVMYAALLEANNYTGPVLSYGDPSTFPGGNYRTLANTVIENTWVPQVQQILDVSNIENEKNPLSILVYPNPTHDGSITIKSKKNIKEFTLFNMLGKKIKDINIENKTELSLDLSDMSSGMYIIQVSDGKNKYSEKLILD